MLLSVLHETRYRYTPAVDLAQHVAHLKPRDTSAQEVLRTQMLVTPGPAAMVEHRDVFGNLRSFFSIETRHDALCVRSESLVRTRAVVEPTALSAGPNWESARDYFRYHKGGRFDPAVEFCFASTHVKQHAAFGEFARPAFKPGRPLAEAAVHLMRRIHTGLRYASQSTEIHTPAHEALARREGVCQDFAHIFLACARQFGLSARYVSGYLLTRPPEGQARLVGADASHAWVSIYLPAISPQGALRASGQWLDLDPTNDHWGLGSPGEDYVTLAIGRDYADVSPLRGVIRGGTQHDLSVAVTVTPAQDSV